MSTLCASSVLVQVHFPGALRNRLKAEKTLVMPAAEIWRLARLLVFWLCSGHPERFVILNKDGQVARGAVLKPAVKTQQTVGLVH